MMSEVCCKRCGAADHVKNGIVRGFQRYHCLSCGCNFTMTPPRGKPPAMKALALLLYAMGNVSFCSIARILGVSDVAVLNWVRDEARKLPEPSLKAELVVVTLDEMWHFASPAMVVLDSGIHSSHEAEDRPTLRCLHSELVRTQEAERNRGGRRRQDSVPRVSYAEPHGVSSRPSNTSSGTP